MIKRVERIHPDDVGNLPTMPRIKPGRGGMSPMERIYPVLRGELDDGPLAAKSRVELTEDGDRAVVKLTVIGPAGFPLEVKQGARVRVLQRGSDGAE